MKLFYYWCLNNLKKEIKTIFEDGTNQAGTRDGEGGSEHYTLLIDIEVEVVYSTDLLETVVTL